MWKRERDRGTSPGERGPLHRVWGLRGRVPDGLPGDGGAGAVATSPARLRLMLGVRVGVPHRRDQIGVTQSAMTRLDQSVTFTGV